MRERDWDDDAFTVDEAPAPVLADSSFSLIALSTAVVSGDVWGRDIEGLADSDFSFTLSPTHLYQVMIGVVCLLQCFEQQPPARR